MFRALIIVSQQKTRYGVIQMLRLTADQQQIDQMTCKDILKYITNIDDASHELRSTMKKAWYEQKDMKYVLYDVRKQLEATLCDRIGFDSIPLFPYYPVSEIYPDQGLSKEGRLNSHGESIEQVAEQFDKLHAALS